MPRPKHWRNAGLLPVGCLLLVGPLVMDAYTTSSVTASLALLIMVNGLGASVGPIITGMVSEYAGAGDEAYGVRFGLLTVCAALPLAGLFFVLASRYIRQEVAAQAVQVDYGVGSAQAGAHPA